MNHIKPVFQFQVEKLTKLNISIVAVKLISTRGAISNMKQMGLIKNVIVMIMGLILFSIMPELVKAPKAHLYNYPLPSSLSVDQSPKKQILKYNWCVIYSCNKKCFGKDKKPQPSVGVGVADNNYEQCFLSCWNMCSEHYLRKGFP